MANKEIRKFKNFVLGKHVFNQKKVEARDNLIIKKEIEYDNGSIFLMKRPFKLN